MTDVDPAGIAVVVSVAVHAESRQLPSVALPSGVEPVPLLAENATGPDGETMTPPTTAAATLAVNVTASPAVEVCGEAVTVVVLGSGFAEALGASATPKAEPASSTAPKTPIRRNGVCWDGGADPIIVSPAVDAHRSDGYPRVSR